MKGFARQGRGIKPTELQNNSERLLQLWPPTVRRIQQEGFLKSDGRKTESKAGREAKEGVNGGEKVGLYGGVYGVSAAVFAQWLKLSNEPHGPWRERAQASFTSPIQGPEKIKHSRWVDKQMGPRERARFYSSKTRMGWMKTRHELFHSSLVVCP